MAMNAKISTPQKFHLITVMVLMGTVQMGMALMEMVHIMEDTRTRELV
jgi:hypothetical protein